jgi:hypothetical protein
MSGDYSTVDRKFVLPFSKHSGQMPGKRQAFLWHVSLSHTDLQSTQFTLKSRRLQRTCSTVAVQVLDSITWENKP